MIFQHFGVLPPYTSIIIPTLKKAQFFFKESDFFSALIAKVIDAFWDVIAEAVEDGDSIKMNSYIKIEPKYYKAVKLNAEGLKWVKENVVPARYRIRFTMGERLKESCRRLSDKKLNNENSDIDL